MSFAMIEDIQQETFQDESIPFPAAKKHRVYKNWTTTFCSVDNLVGLNDKSFHRSQCIEYVNSTFKHNYFSVR